MQHSQSATDVAVWIAPWRHREPDSQEGFEHYVVRPSVLIVHLQQQIPVHKLRAEQAHRLHSRQPRQQLTSSLELGPPVRIPPRRPVKVLVVNGFPCARGVEEAVALFATLSERRNIFPLEVGDNAVESLLWQP